MAEPERQVAPPEQRGELPVAVPEVEDERRRVVLLRVRYQEVQEEALAAAGRAEDERVSDVLNVDAPMKRRVVFGLEHGERLTSELR